MRQRQLNSGDSVTLFPFLAVLICTMGSLIVLLVVVVQQARASADTASDAVAQAVNEFEEERDQRQQSQKTLEWKIELLEESQQAVEDDLARRRLELSHLEDHIRTLAAELEDLQLRARSIVAESESDAATEEDLKQQVALLEQRLIDAEADYSRALKEFKSKEKSYAIVAYAGPHGTERQPIFIECLADKILLQPEGIRLTGDDFREPITDDNPLAMALRAKREYMSKAMAGTGEADPYPLLVVRPGGSQAYAVARAAMRAWDSAFGYELVPDDVNLSYPKEDLAAKKVVEEAVAEARLRREELMAMAPKRFGRMASQRKLRASRNGGFVASGDSSDPNRLSSVKGQGGFGSGSGNGNGDGFGGEFGSGPNEFNQAGLGHGANGSQGEPSDGGSFGRYPEGDGRFAGARDSGSLAQFAQGGSGGGQSRGGASGGSQGAGSGGGPSSQYAGGQPGGGQAGAGAAGTASAGGTAGGMSASNGGAGSPSGRGKSLAKTRGRNWGLPTRSNGGTAITRPISVTCHGDRIVVHSDAAARVSAKVFDIETNVRGEVDKVVSTIWNRIDSWGVAGSNMYWKPVLNVRVTPDGEPVFTELQTLLDNSGITVSRRN